MAPTTRSSTRAKAQPPLPARTQTPPSRGGKRQASAESSIPSSAPPVKRRKLNVEDGAEALTFGDARDNLETAETVIRASDKHLQPLRILSQKPWVPICHIDRCCNWVVHNRTIEEVHWSRNHIRQHCSEAINACAAEKKSGKAAPRARGKKRFQCRIGDCAHGYDDFGSISRHVQEHHLLWAFKCPDAKCKKETFARPATLKRHILREEKKGGAHMTFREYERIYRVKA